MRYPNISIPLLLTLLATSPHAIAQDSVSRNANAGNGLPGDALSPFVGGSQRANFVVDLSPVQGSWGTPLGVAPLIKHTKLSAQRFNAVNGPSVISFDVRASAPSPAVSYTLWTQPGGGLNSAENNTALNSSVPAPSLPAVFGVGVLEFDEQTLTQNQVFNNIAVGAQVALDPASPTRLFVTRVAAAINGPSGQGDRSQFGLGSVDAHGNLLLRADSFQSSGASASFLQGDNYFRVRLLARNATVNSIDNAGGTQSASLDWVAQRLPELLAVPTAIPQSIAGRNVLIGADFAGALRTETSPGTLTSTTAHLPGAQDHRAGPALGPALFSGTVASGAIISRVGSRADSISIFGLTSSGAVSSARTLTLPASIVDGCDAFAWPVSGGDFRAYDSQATFRGGAGPVAVGHDLAGRGLVAGVVYNASQPGTDSPLNAIAVARFDPAIPGSPAQWTLAAWIATTGNDGKDIAGDFGQDGAPSTLDAGEGDGVVNSLDAPIGRLASLSEVPADGVSPVFGGPSLSAPAFDSAGNVYFIAPVALNRLAGSVVVQDFDLALLRAIPDASGACYRLEVLLRRNQVIPGANSGRNYRVAFLGLADADSISSASLWSGSVSGQPWAGSTTTGTLPQSAPQQLGGLVLSSRVIYDTDADGDFSDPTAPLGDVNSADEAYNVTLYLGNVTPVAGCDSLDFNNDGVFPDDADLADFLFVFGGGICPTCNDPDFNNDGVFPDDTDIADFLIVLGGGTC